MVNFHCIPESCVKVVLVYREYKPPVVRWRYSESEPWQEIDGDNYAIDEQKGQCDKPYLVKGRSARNALFYCDTGNPSQTDTSLFSNWSFQTTGKVLGLKQQYYRKVTRYDTKSDGTCIWLVCHVNSQARSKCPRSFTSW